MLGLVLGARVHASSGAPHESDSATGESGSRSSFVNEEPVQLGSLQAAFVRARQAEGARDPAFHVRREAGSLRGVSAPAGIEARFDAHGLEVGGVANGTRGRVALRTIACDERRISAEARMPQVGASPHRMESLRARGELAVSEWYEVGPLGVEQGFDVKARACDRLVLELAVDGLEVEASRDGRIELRDERGVITYDQLFAFDATGRALPSRFETSSSRISLVVETRGAAWPVTVDPLFYVDEQRLEGPVNTLENDGFTESLGAAVALEGDVAIVAAPNDDVGRFEDAGSVYVFRRRAGAWAVEAKLVAPELSERLHFGLAVALSGDTLIVGTPNKATEISSGGLGAAYVFVHDGMGWSPQARLTPSTYEGQSMFGAGVDIDGDRAVVRDSLGGPAYVFVRTGATWSEQQRVVPPRGTMFDRSVVIRGDDLLVGVTRLSVGALTRAGVVFEYRFESGAWSFHREISASDASANAGFGNSLDVDGDRLVVGAYADTGRRGAAYVFERVDGEWIERAKLRPSDGADNQYFGHDVAIHGTTIVVGTYPMVVPSPPDGYYVFEFSGGSWLQRTRLDAAGRSTPVALDGDTILGGEGPNQAYVFDRVGSSWNETPTVLRAGMGYRSPRFGMSVALEGDTAVVGAQRDLVYVFRRIGARWETEASFTGEGNFGWAVALRGDHLFVGAPYGRDGGDSIGSVVVFRRAGTTWSEVTRLRAPVPRDSDAFGSVIAVEGTALLVAAPGSDEDRGAVHVFEAEGTGWVHRQQISAPSEADRDRFGYDLALSEDFLAIASDYSDVLYVYRRDGTWVEEDSISVPTWDYASGSVAFSGATLLIGAPDVEDGRGVVYAYERDGSTWTQRAQVMAPNPMGYFGTDIAIQGDHMLVGADEIWDPFEDIAGPGSVYVFRGAGSAWTEELRVTASDGQRYDRFGASVATDGDWVLVGAPGRARPPYEHPEHGGAYIGRLSDTPGPTPVDAGVGTDGSVTLPDGGPATGDPDGGGSESGGSGGCSCATTSSNGAPSSVVFLFGVTLLALRPSRKRRRASGRG
jgi:hypothetical protein